MTLLLLNKLLLGRSTHKWTRMTRASTTVFGHNRRSLLIVANVVVASFRRYLLVVRLLRFIIGGCYNCLCCSSVQVCAVGVLNFLYSTANLKVLADRSRSNVKGTVVSCILLETLCDNTRMWDLVLTSLDYHAFTCFWDRFLLVISHLLVFLLIIIIFVLVIIFNHFLVTICINALLLLLFFQIMLIIFSLLLWLVFGSLFENVAAAACRNDLL